MPSDKVFLERVYDKYVSVDWSLGRADLNPLREMNLLSFVSNNDDLEALRKAIAEQVEKTKKALELKGLKPLDIDSSPDSTDVKYNSSGSEVRSVNPLRDNRFQAQVGSSRGTLFNTNVSGSDFVSDPGIDEEIGDLLLTLAPIMQNNQIGSSTTARLNSSYYDFSALPYGPLCKAQDLPIENDEGNIIVETYSDSTEALNSLTASVEERETAAQQLLAQLEAQAAEKDMSLEECAYNSLYILKVIAIMISVLNALKTIIAYVLGVLVPVSEICTLASGLWVNPMGVSEIISKLMQSAVAVSVKVMSQVISQLWKLINSNCLVASSLDVLDAIQADLGLGVMALSESGGAFSLLGNVAAIFNQISTKVSEVGKEAESYETEYKETWDSLKKETWDDLGQEAIQSLKGAGNTLANKALDPIKEQINRYNEIKDSLLSVVDSLKETFGSTSNFKQVDQMLQSYKEKKTI